MNKSTKMNKLSNKILKSGITVNLDSDGSDSDSESKSKFPLETLHQKEQSQQKITDKSEKIKRKYIRKT